MDAFLVLQGLMLLSCHKTAMQCTVMIANTPTHAYTAGFVGKMLPLPKPTSSKPVMLTIGLPKATGAKDPFNSTPTGSGAFKTRALLLDGTKVTEDPSHALYVISLPIPDEIWGANYVSLDQTKALNGTDPSLFENMLSGKVRLPETLILRYKGIATTFSLSGQGTPISSGPVSTNPADPSAETLGNILVISSWPDCSMSPHPSDTFDQMVKINGSGGYPTYKFTENYGSFAGADANIEDLNLPLSALGPPSCLNSTAKLAKSKKPKPPKGAMKNKPTEQGTMGIMVNVDATGCGILAEDNP